MIALAPELSRWVAQMQRIVTVKSVQIRLGIGHARPNNQETRAVRMTPSRSALAVVALMFAASAWAQQSPMPEDIAWKLLELGSVIDPPKTAELYAPLQEKEPYQGVTVERDVKYGPADRNLLDIFAPDTAASARPVLIFVHGGAFVGGDKRTTPTSPFYDNIMLWR